MILPPNPVNIGPYKGSKYRALKQLFKYLPSARYYSEPFAGFAAVGLNYSAPYKHLWELNPWVFNLLTQIKTDVKGIQRLLPYIEAEHNPSALDDGDHLGAAVAYLKHAITSYGGGGTRWNTQITKADRLETPEQYARLSARLNLCSLRLQDCELHFQDGLNSLDLLEGKDVLHYLDPPYLNCTRKGKDNRHKDQDNSMTRDQYLIEYSDEEHEGLIDRILQLDEDVKIVLSNYENPIYDRLLAVGFSKAHYSSKDLNGADRLETLWLSPSAKSSLLYYQPEVIQPCIF